MKLSELPDINFVDVDAEKAEQIIFNLYTKTTSRTVAQGDPIRLFLLVITYLFVLLLNNINETGKQNLLRYAKGDFLDHLGAFADVERITAAAATTTLKATISEARAINTTIPAGVRVTAGDNVYFATNADSIILAGETSIKIAATCTTTGDSGNGYLPGELNNIVDPQPYLATLTNVTKSEGGADIEDDESYREAIHEAPESPSTAGSIEGYSYWAKRASTLVKDVAVTTPEAGAVNVFALLKDGAIPEEEMLQRINTMISAEKHRPVTDKVSVLAPTVVEYDVNITYYSNKNDIASYEENIQKAVQEYVLWQKEALGRDINSSELIHVIMATGVKRVEVASPAQKILGPNEVAVANNISIINGGKEDE